MRFLKQALSFLCIAPACALLAAEAPRPNIILVLTDDQGYGELGSHGNPIIQTPHLDRFHAEGVCFTDFQVSPTCAPTRAALMTGMHEFKSGITHTIFERERLNLNATTIAEVLRQQGYSTGIFGKWHLGDEDAYLPERRGFDEVFIHGGGGIGQTYPGSCGDAPDNKYFDPFILHNGRFEKTRGFCTDVFFDQAIRWITSRKAEKSVPFFAYIAINAPHDPWISPGPEYDRLYADKGLEPRAAAYYAMISNIDDNMGKLMKRLRKLQIDAGTLVAFMTDNGHVLDVYNAGMRGTKCTPYQGGIRAASLWRWPNVLPAGKEVDRLAAHIDVFPTFAELAGAGVSKQVEGRSLLPLLKGEKTEWPDRFLFTHIGRWNTGQWESAKYRQCAVRNQRFKLVNNRELYDLQADPAEKDNVIERFPTETAALRSAYDKWWSGLGPHLTNETAVGPKINPFKERYWRQYGGGPDAKLLEQMDPAGKNPSQF
jgi:arylsulfatase